ncbi:Permease of the drug/metabolite transporter (DMT) superfamily [Salinihabitans flavidus]|uniref:Permease of the drug/metabolite transporter (DMT) superfamily n=1 Tax=Salinihabitans flavidus TaxID=569882 RepID=A0A1H8PQV1_9RHOB|nr:DMT family transporter [Salinihabitans flavidus]SEO44305.1 Permease of the drug/metabolite transporter (DMT) superfamily [Salinihabitans flavidus]
MTSPVALFGMLLVLGAGWGLSQPLNKIAVSEGYQPLGIIFWQLVIGATVLGTLRSAQGKPLSLALPYWRTFVLIAIVGTLLPNSFSYRAAIHLPAGVLSVMLSLVPIFAFPIALWLGIDRFTLPRMAGLVVGLVGVVILANPDSMPDPSMVWWLPIALVAPFCYAVEGNIVAKWGTQGLGPGHVLFGASVLGIFIALPLAVISGQFISPFTDWNAPEYAILITSLVHVAVYTGYVWLMGQAGSVFAAQVAYIVTGAGVLWSMLILHERYSLWIWLAMGIILVGMALVQPRRKVAIAPIVPPGNVGG